MKKLKHIFLIGFVMFAAACGGGFNAPFHEEIIPVTSLEERTQSELERAAEEEPVLSPELGRDHKIENDLQVFTLQKLKSLMLLSFRCEVEWDNDSNEKGTMIISFNPELNIKFKNKDFASTKSVCGQSVQEKNLMCKGRGGLEKNVKENTYILNYSLDRALPIFLHIRWDAAQEKDGLIICRRANNNEVLHRGLIRSCRLVTNLAHLEK